MVVGQSPNDKNLLVTVGTTKFDQLIQTIASDGVSSAVISSGYTNWRVQYGAASAEARSSIATIAGSSGLKINTFDYKPSLEQDIEWADLVIGHAGIKAQGNSTES